MLKNLFALRAFNLDAGGGGGAPNPGAGGAGPTSAGGGSPAPGAAPAGAASPAGAAAASPGAKNPFTGEPASQQPPAGMGHNGGPYFPDKLPDHLRGANERETLDKVFAAYSGAREEISRRGSPPKDPSEYAIDFGDDLKAVFGDPSTSAELKVFKSVAHRHGLTKEQVAGIARDYHAGLLSEKIVTPIDYMKEARAIVGDAARGRTEEQIKQEAGKIWQETAGWVDGMVASKAMSKEGGDALKSILESADGIKAVRAIRQLTLEGAINPGAGSGVPGGVTKEDLARRAQSDEVNPLHPKFDPRKARQLEEDYRAFYAGRAA